MKFHDRGYRSQGAKEPGPGPFLSVVSFFLGRSICGWGDPQVLYLLLDFSTSPLTYLFILLLLLNSLTLHLLNHILNYLPPSLLSLLPLQSKPTTVVSLPGGFYRVALLSFWLYPHIFSKQHLHKPRDFLRKYFNTAMMAVLGQYDYLFAVGTIFAFLDAWNIGANDVANSWASSVSSRSITYLQAMCGASVMEFSGALGVGGRVADTIRTKIVDVEAFDESPALLMLGMVCAVIASSVYLTIATRFGFPVSTTHSILGGVLGMGVGALGGSGITWVGYKDDGSLDIQKGVVQVSDSLTPINVPLAPCRNVTNAAFPTRSSSRGL